MMEELLLERLSWELMAEGLACCCVGGAEEEEGAAWG